MELLSILKIILELMTSNKDSSKNSAVGNTNCGEAIKSILNIARINRKLKSAYNTYLDNEYYIRYLLAYELERL